MRSQLCIKKIYSAPLKINFQSCLDFSTTKPLVSSGISFFRILLFYDNPDDWNGWWRLSSYFCTYSIEFKNNDLLLRVGWLSNFLVFLFWRIRKIFHLNENNYLTHSSQTYFNLRYVTYKHTFVYIILWKVKNVINIK